MTISKEWDVDEVCQQHCSGYGPFQSVNKEEDGAPTPASSPPICTIFIENRLIE